jgi:UDP-galactopyranose mutase
MNFDDRLLKNTQVPNFTKIHPVGAKLFHVDRQTMIKLIVTFHNFANMAKINHHVRFQVAATV